jgi:hypothetical protein
MTIRNLMHRMRRAAPCVAIFLAVGGTASATAEEQLVDQLKDSYLACEQAARSTMLSNEDAMRCSVTYEELKQRAFNGEFRLLKTWYDTSRPSASASQ